MLLNILKYPNPLLRKKCRSISIIEPKVAKLAKNMLETMRAAPGVGLAAPQVGENIRLFVADIGDNNPIIAINPKVKKRGGKQIFKEGCLCLPGMEAPVERTAKVTLKCQNEKGENITIEAEGLLATVIQHENDHLDGVLFIDRVKNPDDIKFISPVIEPKEEQL